MGVSSLSLSLLPTPGECGAQSLSTRAHQQRKSVNDGCSEPGSALWKVGFRSRSQWRAGAQRPTCRHSRGALMMQMRSSKLVRPFFATLLSAFLIAGAPLSHTPYSHVCSWFVPVHQTSAVCAVPIISNISRRHAPADTLATYGPHTTTVAVS